MKAFTRVRSVAAPLMISNIDTDSIIPARFLRKSRTEGYGKYLFYDFRFGEKSDEKTDFVLNQATYREAKILLVGRNFGCGSARESAVWALMDFGIRAIVGPSFASIFQGNSFSNGLPLIVLDETVVETLAGAAPSELAVDLVGQFVIRPDSLRYSFDIDPGKKQALLDGVDEIQGTFPYDPEICAYESKRGFSEIGGRRAKTQ